MKDIYDNSVGKIIKVFLINNIKYEGVIKFTDDKTITIFDFVRKIEQSFSKNMVVDFQIREVQDEKKNKSS